MDEAFRHDESRFPAIQKPGMKDLAVLSYLKRNQDNDVLEINHPFYNSGGVHDHIREVKQFLGEKGPTIEPISYEMIYNPEDRLIFQTISNENDLILPLFFSEYIKKPVEEKVNEFNEYIFKRYCDRYELNEIFSQLVQTKKIPNEILFKFWLRAYSSEGNLSKDINEELKANHLDKYLPFIECMYEGLFDLIFHEIQSDKYKTIEAVDAYVDTQLKQFDDAVKQVKDFYEARFGSEESNEDDYYEGYEDFEEEQDS